MKDHYPESVVWESIVQSLKREAADMVRYMGPTTSMAHILQNVMVIFGTVASFDILMQNFYKVMQGNHEMVPSFAMRLEGTLNQIRFSGLGGLQIKRCNSTSKIISSMGSVRILEIQ